MNKQGSRWKCSWEEDSKIAYQVVHKRYVLLEKGVWHPTSYRSCTNPQHLLEMDDPSQGWYVLYKEALHIGLRFPIPQVITRLLHAYDLTLTTIEGHF